MNNDEKRSLYLEIIEEAKREVASWPQWKRDLADRIHKQEEEEMRRNSEPLIPWWTQA